MTKKTKEVAVIDKLEELKDYATQFENLYLIDKVNQIIKEIKTDEINQELSSRVFKSEPIASKIENIIGNQIIQSDYHEADVDVKGVVDSIIKADGYSTSEVTWGNIYNLFQDQTQLKKDLSIKDAFDWLSKNYNPPTKKQ